MISPALFEAAGVPSDGENINGPSLVRVPDWVENSLGRYYLYFAGHNSTYIRMAYADDLRGPWTLFRPGEGVLSLGDGIRLPGPPLEIRRHIASPDVHLDHENRRFILYFHGPVWLAGTRIMTQRTSHASGTLPSAS